MRIISILDNDFYKFTMQQAVVNLFPRAKAKYSFINRGNHSFPNGFAEILKQHINEMPKLKLSVEESNYLRHNCPYFTPTYLDFLQGFRYDPTEVDVQQKGGKVSVSVEGYWYRIILWEVPLLFMISELFYECSNKKRINNASVTERAKNKMGKYRNLDIPIADFGTRRRFSYEVQKITVEALKENGNGSFIGTSNVHLAMLHQTKPIGTHAHEWFMFHAAKFGFKMANRMALENWVKVYRGELGIALSDTYTTDIFFESFDKKFSKLFDGVRQDSGDPLEFAEKTVRHYRKMGIDPISKDIIFSDNLNYEKVKKIAKHCKGKIGTSFGIGTNFTNDVGVEPMNIVIKMTHALPEDGRWQAVVKLSDSKAKHTGEEDMIRLAKKVLGI